ncbi:MAG TPA: type III glutamate--ammonia ligase [Planctomycetaceae bacterium]|nr:type III glutamate--ammonia ligase [Planctomycetaceae bacterium]
MTTDRAQLREILERDGIEFLLVQFVDIHGAAKAKMVPVGCLDDVLDVGAGFAGGALWGAGQGPHSHDMLARIDPTTYTRLPWHPNTARFASNLFVDGQPHPYCCRTNLVRVLSEARAKGYVLNVGMEPEFFLVTRADDGSIRPWDPQRVDRLRKPCYDFRSMAPAIDFLQELTSSLNGLGWGVYQVDHEDGNSQFEVNFGYADALITADRITFFKMASGQIAGKYGAIATHMAKPFAEQTGSGLHVHFHLADARTGKNLFLDESDSRSLGLSQTAYHFLGGVIEHARAVCAVTSPTVNCYKRLQVGQGLYSTRSGFTWTPAFAGYGDNNRTQMIRVAGPGHCEDRTVSAGCNPYLGLAALLSAGLDGIARHIDPGQPNLGNLYERTLTEIANRGLRLLPQSLDEALAEFEKDKIVRGALGVIADEFLDLKAKEWKTYNSQVTTWETEQYLTAF